MVQTFKYGDKTGYCLTERDMQNIEKIEVNGETRYFIPHKTNLTAKLSIDEISRLIMAGHSRAEIAKIANHSLSWVNTQCRQKWDTTQLDKIKEQISKSMN